MPDVYERTQGGSPVRRLLNGGIELALHDVFNAEPAWFSEFDTAPSKILAHHWPDVPNHGDVTKINWSQVEPVDIITGGSPCQDLSHAGKRAGMRAGTRSGLWASMCDAIDIIRPSLVIWENVRGAYSASADSAVEPCPICVGDGRGVTLRALGRVLGDLAELGYDAAWCGIRAADVGAPHGRFRVFVLAWPAGDTPGWGGSDEPWSGYPARQYVGSVARPAGGVDARGVASGVPVLGRDAAELAADVTWGSREWRDLTLMPTPRATDGTKGGPNQRGSSGALMLPSAVLFPTPTVSDTNGAGAHGDGGLDLRTAVSLLPTPVVNDMGAGKTVDAWDAWTERLKSSHDNGNGHGASLSIEALRMLPTPTVGDSKSARNSTATRHVLPPTGIHAGDTLTDALVPIDGAVRDFGQYGPAIARWESLTRPAPAPTEPTGKGGAHRLSPAFVEWLMGLPAGWVTDVPDVSRNDQLKALGNGVVPQQCAAAIRHLLTIRAAALEAAA